MNIVYSECGFVALGTKHAIRTRHVVICGLPPPRTAFSDLSHKQEFGKAIE
jgi:hypothetical protein